MNFSKKNLAIFFAFLSLFYFNIFAQNSNNVDSTSIQLEQTEDSADSEEVPFYINQNSSEEEKPSRFGTFFLFLRMILVLAFVVACIYGVMWLMKRSMKTTSNNTDPFLRRVSSVDLLPGKSVHVVTLLDHAYIVGVSDNSVNLIGQLDSSNEKDDELIKAMNLYADKNQNVKKPKSFSDVLDIFMPGGPRDKGGIFSDTQKKMNSGLKNQRDKLNGGE